MKKSLYEVYRERAQAQKDLLSVQALLKAVNDGLLSQEQSLYLQDLYKTTEVGRFAHWRTCLEMEEERILRYLDDSSEYIGKMTDPRRSLPKKKQRELGLLPPV